MTDRPEPITADDEGKPVVDDEERQIGVIDSVTDAAVTIAFNSDTSEDTLGTLWSVGADASPIPIERQALKRVPTGSAESYVETFRVDPQALDRQD